MNVKTILAAKNCNLKSNLGGDLVSIEPTADLAAAAALLSAHRIGAVVICGAGGRLAGILSERDIVRAISEQGAAALTVPVGQVMTRNVATCGEDDDIASIMERMTAGKFRHMPVIENDRLIGLVSIGDVVKQRVEEIERESEAMRDYIRDGVIYLVPLPFTGGANAVIASVTASIDFSAASLPMAMASAARWKSNQPILPSRGEISTSGGSPARRARVMRSCMTLKASTITVGMPGRPRVPKNWRRSERLPNRPRIPPVSSSGGIVAVVGAVIGDDGAAAEQIGIEIDRDHQAGAERARRRHRHWIDQRAVHQPAPADAHRREYPRQCVGSAQRVGEPAVGEPDFVAGVEFGGDSGKADRQIFDAGIADRSHQTFGKMAAADQAGAGKTDVEIAQDAAHGERAPPGLHAVELVGGVAAADHGADRGADDDVRHDAVGDERAHHADMGKAARSAAAERQADDRPRAGGFQ